MINRSLLVAAFFVIFGGTLAAADVSKESKEGTWRTLKQKVDKKARIIKSQDSLKDLHCKIRAISIDISAIITKLDCPAIYDRAKIDLLKGKLEQSMDDIVLFYNRSPQLGISEWVWRESRKFWNEIKSNSDTLCATLPKDE